MEMKDLLADNMALQGQLDAIHAHPAYPLPVVARPRLGDIHSPLMWIYCFLTYAAVRSSDPQVRDLLTYGRLIIRESQRHGGNGWLEYDKVFRQQAALDESVQWNELNPSLFASTILSAHVGPSVFCSLCQEADHHASNCALAFFQAPPSQRPPQQGHVAAVAQPPQYSASVLPTPKRTVRPETLERISVSWNKGCCVFPGSCQFRHVCASCRKRGHRARDCSETPEGSVYKARVRVSNSAAVGPLPKNNSL